MQKQVKSTPRYAVIDLEATMNSGKRKGKIIQIGLVLLEEGRITGEYSWDIDPCQEIPQAITALTGIDNERVEKAPIFKEVADEVWKLLEGRIFVAHHIDFDYPLLRAHFLEAGLPKLRIPGIDTLELVKILYPDAPSYKLQNITEYLGIRMGRAHDALEDAKATAHLLLEIQKYCAKLPKEILFDVRPLSPSLIADTGHYLCTWLEEEAASPLPVVKKHDLYLKAQTLSHTQETVQETKKARKAFNKSQTAFINEIWQAEREKLENITLLEGTASSIEGALLLYALLEKSGEEKILFVSHTRLAQKYHQKKTVGQLEKWLGRPVHAAQLKSSSYYIHLPAFRRYLLEKRKQKKFYKKHDAKRLLALLFWLLKTESGDIDELNSSLSLAHFVLQINQEGRLHLLVETDMNDWGEHAFYQKAKAKASQAEVIFLNQAYLLAHQKELRQQFTLDSSCKLILENAQELANTVCMYNQISLDMVEMEEVIAGLQGGLVRLVHLNAAMEREDIDYFSLLEALQALWMAYDRMLDDWRMAYQKRSYYLSEESSQKGLYLGNLSKSPIYASIQAVYLAVKQMQSLLTQLLKQQNYHPILLIVDSFYIETMRLELTLKALIEEQEAYVYSIQPSWKAKEFYGKLLKQNLEAKMYLQKFFNNWLSSIYLLTPSTQIMEEEGLLEYELGLTSRKVRKIQFKARKGKCKQPLYYYPTEKKEREKLEEDQIRWLVEHLHSLSAFDTGKWVVYIPNLSARRLLVEALQKATANRPENLIYHLDRYPNAEILAQRFHEAKKGILLISSTASLEIYLQEPICAFFITRLPFRNQNEPRELALQNLCQKEGRSYFYDFALPRMLMELGYIFRTCYQQQADCQMYCLDSRIQDSAYAERIQYYIKTYIKGPTPISFT